MLTAALVVVAVASLAIYCWRKLEKANKYWEELGVPSPPNPMPLFGHIWSSMITKTISLTDMVLNFYNMFPDEPYFGYYQFMQPALMVKDLELVERILIKDFQHFTDHAMGNKAYKPDPVDVNLFGMEGKKWRAFRNKFSPLFTTGKLRHMVPQMEEISDRFVKYLENQPVEVDLRDMFQRFAMDVIASTAFGIKVDAITSEGEAEEFIRMGKLAHSMTWDRTLRLLTVLIFPRIANLLRLSPNHPTANRYFSKILIDTMTQRKNSKMTRNDFVQLFVALQQKGSLEFEGDEEDDYLRTDGDGKNEKIELTDDVMVGQVFLFFVAGFEGTSIAMMYLCYELAMNPEIQSKAREEVLAVVKKRGGVLDYDCLKEMNYFSQCLTEMLRIHTSFPALFRVCTKDYTFPSTSLSIKKGQVVFIPVVGIHNDPKYYDEPEKFKPERWDPDIKHPNCSYLPFGDGPRVCIAMRFALTEVKLGVARMLMNYIISISPKTKLPLEMDTTNFISVPKTPVYFDLTKISDSIKK